MKLIHSGLTALASLLAVTQARTLSPLQHQLRSSIGRRDENYSKNVSSCPGYTLSSVNETSSGLTAQLYLAGTACNAFGNDVNNLTIAVSYESNSRLHVNIYDTNQTHFTVPKEVVTPPGQTEGSTNGTSELVFNYEASPFTFWITRRSDPDASPIFDTRISSLPNTPTQAVRSGDASTVLDGFPLVFEDGYLQLTSALPYDANVYGLGEAVTSSGIRRAITGDGTIQTNWARDAPDPPNANMYGNHPFYLEHRLSANTSTTHGVFINSAAGADTLLLTPPSSNVSLIEYRLLGGTLDLYFFAGPTSQSVVEQYSAVVGTPTWAPLWALGFHLCRWGWANVSEVQSVVARMKEANIPLETMWNDIDLYHSYRDFTVDPIAFPADEMKAYIQSLHDNNQHYIPIVDAAVAHTIPNGTDVYKPYDVGTTQGVFIKNPDGSEYIGKVWPGYTVFPDYFHPNTTSWWTQTLQEWYDLGIEFDGLWEDMNEVSSFCDGSCGSNLTAEQFNAGSNPGFALPGEPGNEVNNYPECYHWDISGRSGNITVNGTLTCLDPHVNHVRKRGVGAAAEGIDVSYPPYSIHNPPDHLWSNAVATNATHYGGYMEFDTHNLYGTMEEIASHSALQKIHPGKRPFIIARSTFAGAGKYSGHWLGDNFSGWDYLHYMIQGILQFQWFQIQMVGADTCGFNGNTDEELCNRWMQAGAFTPFYRNHNTKGAISQEPYVWDSVAEASRIAIHERLRMLPYWYTLFANASRHGSPTVRPLFFEFPTAQELFSVDAQWLVGRDILITPVLQPNVSTVTGYFPSTDGSQWRHWFTHELVNSTTGTDNVTLTAPLSYINVHLRSGAAVLLYAKPKYTVKETSDGPYELIVFLRQDGTAEGTAYFDDGETYPPADSKDLQFSAHNGQLDITSLSQTGSGYCISNPLANITVLGVPSEPATVQVQGQSAQFDYDAGLQRLVVAGVNVTLNDNIKVSWS